MLIHPTPNTHTHNEKKAIFICGLLCKNWGIYYHMLMVVSSSLWHLLITELFCALSDVSSLVTESLRGYVRCLSHCSSRNRNCWRKLNGWPKRRPSVLKSTRLPSKHCRRPMKSMYTVFPHTFSGVFQAALLSVPCCCTVELAWSRVKYAGWGWFNDQKCISNQTSPCPPNHPTILSPSCSTHLSYIWQSLSVKANHCPWQQNASGSDRRKWLTKNHKILYIVLCHQPPFTLTQWVFVTDPIFFPKNYLSKTGMRPPRLLDTVSHRA